MARSKIWIILDKTGTNAWWDNMMGNNVVVSEWKQNFKLPQPTPRLFAGGILLILVLEATNSLLTIFIVNVPGVVVLCKRLGIRISL